MTEHERIIFVHLSILNGFGWWWPLLLMRWPFFACQSICVDTFCLNKYVWHMQSIHAFKIEIEKCREWAEWRWMRWSFVIFDAAYITRTPPENKKKAIHTHRQTDTHTPLLDHLTTKRTTRVSTQSLSCQYIFRYIGWDMLTLMLKICVLQVVLVWYELNWMTVYLTSIAFVRDTSIDKVNVNKMQCIVFVSGFFGLK